MTASSTIPRQSLTSAVADKLRDKIVRGELKEGEQLRQDAIANEFQVSRIPVREALRQLEAEGLITIILHRGAVVSSLSPTDILEVFQMRALLEAEVLRASIPNLSEDHLRAAEEILRRYDEALWTEGDVGSWGRLNTEFHSALYAGAERPQFMSVIRTLNYKGERYIRLQLYLTREVERAKQEHRMLLDLCRARNVDGAVELVKRHILFAGESLRDFVVQHRQQQAQASQPGANE
jgi:DNA-binding GntR family transcriptional regulator